MDRLAKLHRNGHISHALSIDFAKSFNRVPHFSLHHELQRYGLRGLVLKILLSLLTGGNILENVGSPLSQTEAVNVGYHKASVVHQGPW